MLHVKFVTLLCIITCALLDCVENKSYFGIGNRLIGDQLLVKDVLQAPPISFSYNREINFNYAVPEPITYIEILSEENVNAEVHFSYKDDLVKGIITALDSRLQPVVQSTPDTIEFEISEPNPFMIQIRIYGYNDTVHNLNSKHVINRDQFFNGILEPLYDEVDEYLSESDEALAETFEETQTVDADLHGNDTNNASNDDDDDDDDEDFEHTDNIIELGQRQNGDYLIYETFQTSSTTSEEPTNHSIVFYYIDSNFITYVKFVIYDHFIVESLPDKNAPIAEYSHISQKTLKAVITDNHTKSLFAQMFLYGYKPDDRPHTYMPYLIGLHRSVANIEDVTATTVSSVKQLKMWLNAMQRGDTMTTISVPANISDNGEDNNDNDNKTENAAGDADGVAELPFYKNAAFSMSMNLLIKAPYTNFIGISSSFCVLWAITLLLDN